MEQWVWTTGTVLGIFTSQWPTSENTGSLDAVIEVQDQATQQSEYFLLWLNNGQLEPPWLWIVRSLNLSLLREALIHKRTVGIRHWETAAYVLNVELR
jgi:hypothetical protein